MKKKKEIEVNKTISKQYLYRRKAYDEMAELCYGAKTFNSYAGRGIHVCDDWKNAYDNFVVDMGDRPDNSTLERYDRNKGFSKENCYWKVLKIKRLD